MLNNKKLGKGIQALLESSGLELTKIENTHLLENDTSLQEISLSKILPDPKQPRKYFSESELNSLAKSIKQKGLLQPLLITPHPSRSGYFLLVAGERRYRALQINQTNQALAIIIKTDQLMRLEIALIENIQRENLKPLELANSYELLHQQFNLSYQEIAQKIGKNETTVINIIRLNKLSDTVKALLDAQKISEGHARCLIGLPAEIQNELAQQIIAEGLSVRQTEQLVHSVKKMSGDKNYLEYQKTIIDTKDIPQPLREIKNNNPFIKNLTYQKNSKSIRVNFVFSSDKDLNLFIERFNDNNHV